MKILGWVLYSLCVSALISGAVDTPGLFQAGRPAALIAAHFGGVLLMAAILGVLGQLSIRFADRPKKKNRKSKSGAKSNSGVAADQVINVAGACVGIALACWVYGSILNRVFHFWPKGEPAALARRGPRFEMPAAVAATSPPAATEPPETEQQMVVPLFGLDRARPAPTEQPPAATFPRPRPSPLAASPAVAPPAGSNPIMPFPGGGPAVPPAGAGLVFTQSSNSAAAGRPARIPEQTLPVDASTSLKVGTRVLSAWGQDWSAAVVTDVLAGGQVKIHFLQWPSSFDETVAQSGLRIPIPEKEIPEEALAALQFEILRSPPGVAPAVPSEVEAQLLALEGYIPDSLKIDASANQVALKVVRGSDAEKKAQFALLQGHLFIKPASTRMK